ncbi:prepilin peptidase [Amycolatopsis sp. NPDC051371]|uniref:prepilin peptidase n=1 Tax=Amycolatopsis sp. NPDC051371 TaxID=3155800 RepID=UPI00342D499D
MPPTIFVLTTAAAAGAATAPLSAWALGRAEAPIPVRRAAALAAAGVTLVTALWLSGGCPGWWLPVPILLTIIAVSLALADLRHLRLPDALTLPAYPLFGAAIGAAALGGGGPSLAARAAAGALLFGGAHALVARAAPGSLGAGDVKLSGSLGAVLGAAGWPALALAAILSALFSLAVAIAQSAGQRRARGRAQSEPTTHPAAAAGRRLGPHPPPSPGTRPAPIPPPIRPFGGHRVPHGPALLAATWLCALFPGAP